MKTVIRALSKEVSELKKRSDGSNLDIKKAAPGGRLFLNRGIEQMFYGGVHSGVSKMQKNDSG